MIRTINKPAAATKNKATVIDHIFTITMFDNNLKTAMSNTDLYHHFPSRIIKNTSNKNS